MSQQEEPTLLATAVLTVILVTGPIGAGKSTTAKALGKALSGSSVIDGDDIMPDNLTSKLGKLRNHCSIWRIIEAYLEGHRTIIFSTGGGCFFDRNKFVLPELLEKALGVEPKIIVYEVGAEMTDEDVQEVVKARYENGEWVSVTSAVGIKERSAQNSIFQQQIKASPHVFVVCQVARVLYGGVVALPNVEISGPHFVGRDLNIVVRFNAAYVFVKHGESVPYVNLVYSKKAVEMPYGALLELLSRRPEYMSASLYRFGNVEFAILADPAHAAHAAHGNHITINRGCLTALEVKGVAAAIKDHSPGAKITIGKNTHDLDKVEPVGTINVRNLGLCLEVHAQYQ